MLLKILIILPYVVASVLVSQFYEVYRSRILPYLTNPPPSTDISPSVVDFLNIIYPASEVFIILSAFIAFYLYMKNKFSLALIIISVTLSILVIITAITAGYTAHFTSDKKANSYIEELFLCRQELADCRN